jgi:Cu/Zn superoxide dismutase
MISIARCLGALVGVGLLVAIASSAPAADSTTVKLAPSNNSGESGTATLTKQGDKQTKVVVAVTGAPAGAPQPMHIHKGTCAKLDAKPAYPLSPVVDGKSETVVAASLDDLEKGDYAINGHKSAKEVSTYVFCGDIKAQ